MHTHWFLSRAHIFGAPILRALLPLLILRAPDLTQVRSARMRPKRHLAVVRHLPPASRGGSRGDFRLPPRAQRDLVRAAFRAASASAGALGADAKDSAVEEPDEGKVGDDDGCGGLADVPVDPGVGEGGGEGVVFVEDCGDDDEDSQAEDADKGDFLGQGYLDADEHGDADQKHDDIGGDVEDGICD